MVSLINTPPSDTQDISKQKPKAKGSRAKNSNTRSRNTSTKPKPSFVCTICNVNFKRSEHLVRHKRSRKLI